MPWVSKEEATKLNIPHKTLQTIEINRHQFNLRQAKKWLKDHSYANAYYRTTTNYWRFMQTPPIVGATYQSKKLNDYIILVFQHY
jgi:hypothetical protein